jgi:hypothetical protein
MLLNINRIVKYYRTVIIANSTEYYERNKGYNNEIE